MNFRERKLVLILTVLIQFAYGCDGIRTPYLICDNLNPLCAPRTDYMPLEPSSISPIDLVNFIRMGGRGMVFAMEEYARYNAAREQAVILARAAAAARNQFARQIENRVEEAEQQALLRLWEKIQRKAVEEFPDINRQLESIYKEAGKRGYGSLKDLDRRILIGLKQHCEVLFNHSDAMLKIAVNNSAVTRREALEVFHNIRYKSAAVATKIEEILKVTGN